MKDKYWHIDAMDYLLFALSLLGILLVILSHRAKNDVDNLITTTDTITVTDTITNWRYDTLFISRLDTVKLPIVRTDTTLLIDTLIDSIYVQIPINTYVYDTTITDTNYKTNLRAVVEGFAVSLDTLSIHTEITRQETILMPKQRCWGIGAGLMYGTGGFGLGVGVFYKLF